MQCLLHPFIFAESEGFEPPIRRNAYTAFRVRLFRPLRQLSFACTRPNTIRNNVAHMNFHLALRSPHSKTRFTPGTPKGDFAKSGCKSTAFF